MSAPVYAEDVVIGVPYPLGSYTMTRDEIVSFADSWDPQPMHVDEVEADAGRFGGLIASGVHTFGVFQRLAVTQVYSDWQIIAGRAVELRFRKPVRPGTVLTGDVVITAVTPRDETRSLVSKEGRLLDQEGDVVFQMRAEAYMVRRQTASAIRSQRER